MAPRVRCRRTRCVTRVPTSRHVGRADATDILLFTTTHAVHDDPCSPPENRARQPMVTRKDARLEPTALVTRWTVGDWASAQEIFAVLGALGLTRRRSPHRTRWTRRRASRLSSPTSRLRDSGEKGRMREPVRARPPSLAQSPHLRHAPRPARIHRGRLRSRPIGVAAGFEEYEGRDAPAQTTERVPRPIRARRYRRPPRPPPHLLRSRSPSRRRLRPRRRPRWSSAQARPQRWQRPVRGCSGRTCHDGAWGCCGRGCCSGHGGDSR
jgi:hypothetical protein